MSLTSLEVADKAGELLAMKRIEYDRKLDKMRELTNDPDNFAEGGGVRGKVLILQGEILEMASVICQLQDVVGMEYDGNRPLGWKGFIEYTTKKIKEQENDTDADNSGD